MAMTICAAGLSLTACSAGITTASPATSPSHTASPSPSAAATVRVNAPIGSFPIPQGAQVAYNISCAKQINIAVSPVTPAQSSTFYAAALLRAGYKIESNITSSDPNTGDPQGLAEIEFTGHGFTGAIITVADLGAEASADSSITLPTDLTKNVAEITMSADGTPGSYICPA
jgi:hypothetical protein